MPRHPFRFKQFAMTDQHCGMRIGTDGVVLGAWASANEDTRHVADIGTGCGLIALMMAQRAANARIDAVENDRGACIDADHNFRNSDWSNRINLIECDFAQFSPNARYDIIVSNPPFFTETLQSPDSARAAARHAGSLSFSSLAAASHKLLSDDGRLAVVLPAENDDETLFQAALAGLCPRRRCAVLPRIGAKPIRTLWEFALCDGPCEHSELALRDPAGNFSKQYIDLTKEFHIHL